MTTQQRLVLWVCILASFVAFLDGSIVNVALPAIAREFHAGFVVQQWVVDAYMITLGALMLVAGSLSDIFGRKKILQIGLIGFGAASLACAFAPTSTLLIIFRALQGIAGALLVPSSLAIIMSEFKNGDQAKAIGNWTAWTGIAFIIGPLTGGIMIDALSWRLIFAINVVPIAVTLWLMHSLKLTESSHHHTKLDVAGAALCSLGLGGTVFALIEQSRLGWSSPAIYLPLVLGLVALTWFIWHERHSPRPMMPLGMFSARNFAVGNVATFAIYAGLALATFIISIFVQQVGGYSATEAGLALMPPTVIMFFLSPRFGALAGRLGPRAFMAAGPMIAGAGFLSMLFVDASAHYLVLLPGILLFGLGLSVTVAPLTAAILGAVDSQRSGIASAVNNVVARIAGLVAIAAIGALVGTHLNLAGFHHSLLVIAGLMLLGGTISAIGIQNRPRTNLPDKAV